MPSACDDGPFGKGTGGQLRYAVSLPANGSKTVWVAVAGSDAGVAPARSELAAALKDPAGALEAKIAAREKLSSWTQLSLPGDPQLARGIDWGKQNLADLTQVAENLQVRFVDQGKQYPPPQGRIARARWIGAGFPDYPWIFATDAEYTSFASVTTGQFEAIEDHMRVLRDISDIVNERSGKVTHEITADGGERFGQNKDPGNTDETVKFPSTVALIWRWTGDDRFRDDMYDFAKRNLRYVDANLDADHDGWPEGLGNVERAGMGEEKLDNTVYWIRGLYDLADSPPPRATRRPEVGRQEGGRPRAALRGRVVDARGPQHADSLKEPGDQKQTEALDRRDADGGRAGRRPPGRPRASRPFDHGTRALARARRPASAAAPYNPACSTRAAAAAPRARASSTISLKTSIRRSARATTAGWRDQQRRYTDANVETMFGEPARAASPTSSPARCRRSSSPDFGRATDKNIDRCWTCRAMFMQAWGKYGTAWAVVHQQLGIRPDLGRGT